MASQVRLEDAILCSALQYINEKDTLALFGCCRYFRNNAALEERALQAHPCGKHQMMRCSLNWFDLLPRFCHERGDWILCDSTNHKLTLDNISSSHNNAEKPQESDIDDEKSPLPHASLADIDQPARVLSLVYSINKHVLPFCCRSFHDCSMCTYYFRPVLLPIASSGAKLTGDAIRDALNQVVSGFGDDFVDTRIVTSDVGVHWENIVGAEDGATDFKCKVCPLRDTIIDDYREKVEEMENDIWERTEAYRTELEEGGMTEADADDLVDEMKEKLEREVFPEGGLYSPEEAEGGDSDLLIHILEKSGVPSDLVLGKPGYKSMSHLEFALSSTGLQTLCEKACVPLYQFFARAGVTHVKRMPIKWHKKDWFGSRVRTEYTYDVQLIAGVSPAGFLVGVYVLGWNS